MSSLSNLPYGKIIDYWYEKLKGNRYRYKFLLTKIIEVLTFKSYSSKGSYSHNYFQFPKPIKNSISNNAKISIVIPTFIKSEKDKQDIANLLKSIENQILPPSEVIIIDDCSPILYKFPNNITVIRLEKNSGPAKARNLGKEIAVKNGSDIIAFTDTDCILSNNWTSIILQSFIVLKDFNLLSGNTISYDKKWFGIYHNLNGTLNGRKFKNSEKLLYGTTANLAITKEVSDLINFNENFPNAAGEDIEFCFKANRKGFAIKHIPEMIVYHNYGYTGKLLKDIKLFRQQFKKYGKGEKILLNEIPNYYAYFDRTVEIGMNKNELQ